MSEDKRHSHTSQSSIEFLLSHAEMTCEMGELYQPWCMKPLLQSPMPSVTASSRVEQSPWETKPVTHTVGQLHRNATGCSA